jgi:hypothetical protein
MHTNSKVPLRGSTVTLSRNTTSVMKLVVSIDKSSQKGPSAAVTQLQSTVTQHARPKEGTFLLYNALKFSVRKVSLIKVKVC